MNMTTRGHYLVKSLPGEAEDREATSPQPRPVETGGRPRLVTPTGGQSPGQCSANTDRDCSSAFSPHKQEKARVWVEERLNG